MLSFKNEYNCPDCKTPLLKKDYGKTYLVSHKCYNCNHFNIYTDENKTIEAEVNKLDHVFVYRRGILRFAKSRLKNGKINKVQELTIELDFTDKDILNTLARIIKMGAFL